MQFAATVRRKRSLVLKVCGFSIPAKSAEFPKTRNSALAIALLVVRSLKAITYTVSKILL